MTAPRPTPYQRNRRADRRGRVIVRMICKLKKAGEGSPLDTTAMRATTLLVSLLLASLLLASLLLARHRVAG